MKLQLHSITLLIILATLHEGAKARKFWSTQRGKSQSLAAPINNNMAEAAKSYSM